MRGLNWWPCRKTILELLQVGAEKGDERVSSLASEEGTSNGIPMAELEPLVRHYWEKSEKRRRRKKAKAKEKEKATERETEAEESEVVEDADDLGIRDG